MKGQNKNSLKISYMSSGAANRRTDNAGAKRQRPKGHTMINDTLLCLYLYIMLFLLMLTVLLTEYRGLSC